MGRCRKPREKEEARRLRRDEGMALKRIASRLGVAVSTVHLWTRDIELTSEQLERNRSGPGGPMNPEDVRRRAETWRRVNRERRLAYQLEGRRRARERDPLHMAGCMLYWAEGAKSRNVLRFANSDGPMVRLFARFLRESLAVTNDRFRFHLNVYTNNGLSIEEIESHWIDLLEVPRTSLRKHQLDHYPTSSSGRKRRRLPYGVCTLGVARSTPELQHIYGAIQAYCGFDEPAWLDGPTR
jgi:hypothetical protein